MRFLFWLVAGSLCFSSLWGQNLLPNPSFEEGEKQPAGWQLRGGAGQWAMGGHTGKRCLQIQGDGQSSDYWFTPLPELSVMGVYRFSFWARALPGTSGGCFVSGTSFCNRDYQLMETWRQYSFVFCAPGKYPEAICRLGQWMVRGSGQFDDVALQPVLPVHYNVGEGDIVLGEGEQINGNQYIWATNFGGPGSNYSRCLHSATASFNSNRWVFGPGNELIYKLQVGHVLQTAARVTVTIGWYAAGVCVVEAARSLEANAWEAVGRLEGVATKTFSLPAALFPTPTVYLRLRSPGAQEKSPDFAPGSFQVYNIRYEATITQEFGHIRGQTSFLDVLQASTTAAVESVNLEPLLPGQPRRVSLRVRPSQQAALEAVVELDGQSRHTTRALGRAQQPSDLVVPVTISSAGTHTLKIAVKANGVVVWAAQTEFFVPLLYEANYGYALPAGRKAELWWCEGTYKVSQERPAPTKLVPQVRLAAARNEYEPVQIVLRPTAPVARMWAEMSDMTGPGGSRIPRSAFSVKLVEYLYVTHPTDESSCPGWWPDPLPPLKEPCALEKGRNYPLWLTVKVPAQARPGRYYGQLTLRLDEEVRAIPIVLQVYDFTMPARSHLKTAWGWSWGNVREYHNLKEAADQAQVHDLYLQNFREHRIAPIDFAQLQPIKVNIEGLHWNGGQIVSEEAAEGRYCMKVVDDKPTANIQASTAQRLPVEAGVTYRLSWAAKTAQAGQLYHLTLGCHDAQGNWLSGRNIDFVFEGTGEWQRHSVTLGPERFAEGTASVSLTLWGARWSEKGEQTGITYWDDLYFGRADGGPNLIPDPSFESGYQDVKVVVDWSGFDQAAHKYLDEYGFNNFRLPVQFLGWGSYPEFYKGRIGPFEEGTPEYERLFAGYVKELQDHLEQKGWLDKAYLYWFDEPEPGDYEFVRHTNERIHKYAPKLQRMLTEEPVPPLLGAVDIWCPVTPNYNREICQARQKQGEKIWWYICCWPQAPWAALFIDHGATELRIWMWQTWQNDVEGCLIWESTFWTSPGAPQKPQNPWQDPMGWTPTGGMWGNGDGRFLYPANRDYPHDKRPYVEGPVDSLRWEMLREGLEDWEYLYLLREAIRQKLPGAAQYAGLLQVPPSISQDMRHFAREPQPIYARRAQLAVALEKLKVDRLGIK